MLALISRALGALGAVADEPCSEPWGAEAMAPLSPSAELAQHLVGRGLAAGDAGRDADAVVGGPAHDETGRRLEVGADPGHPLEVADEVLREATAPARDGRGDRS